MNQYRSYLVFLALVIFISIGLNAQQTEHETNRHIPELADFHEIMYPIWHEAFPEKNYKSLREYSPDVILLAGKIYEAELPGILRDKMIKWKEGVSKFRSSVEEYMLASEGEDDTRLLDAAELLHSNYEALVRIVRPVVKEVDEYHKDLYMVFHHYLPNKELDKVKNIAEDLVKKAQLLTAAKLPARLAEKQLRYDKSVEELITNTNYFVETLSQDDYEVINSALDKMHTSYQKLEAVFD